MTQSDANWHPIRTVEDLPPNIPEYGEPLMVLATVRFQNARQGQEYRVYTLGIYLDDSECETEADPLMPTWYWGPDDPDEPWNNSHVIAWMDLPEPYGGE